MENRLTEHSGYLFKPTEEMTVAGVAFPAVLEDVEEPIESVCDRVMAKSEFLFALPARPSTIRLRGRHLPPFFSPSSSPKIEP